MEGWRAVAVVKPISLRGMSDGDRQALTGIAVSALVSVVVWWVFARKHIGVEGILKK